MSAPDAVRQGRNYDFQYALEGTNLSGFVYTLEAKQYPGDTATISRTVTADNNNIVKMTLTPAETAGMAIGLWYVSIKSVDADENIEESTRIEVVKSWT